MTIRHFEEAEIGIGREDLTRILEEWITDLTAETVYSKGAPAKITSLRLSPDAKYVLRFTFTHSRERVSK